MLQVILTADIFSLLILMVIMYAQFKKKQITRSVKYFNVCLAMCMLADIGDIVYFSMDYFAPQYRGSWGYMLALAVTYGVSFSFTACLYKYCVDISTLEDGFAGHTLRVSRVILHCLALSIFVSCLCGQLIDASGAKNADGPAYVLYELASIATFVVAVISLIIIWKRIQISIFRVIVIGVVIMGIIGAFSYFSVGINLFYPVFSLVMLLLYILVQNEQVNLSQIETTRKALERANEANALLEQSYEKLAEQHKHIDALASMYLTMHYVNFEEQTYKEIFCIDRIRGLVEFGDESRTMQERLWSTMMDVARNDYKDKAIAFTNLSNLSERMAGKSYISLDIKNYMNDSWRFLFIRVGKTDEPVNEVIYASQFVEE